jgi:hypothetical protein
MSNVLEYYFFNNYNYMHNIIFSFAIGLVFSPFSSGLKYYIAFTLASVFLNAFVTRMTYPYWNIESTCASLAMGFMGFISGRTVLGFRNPIEGNEKIKKEEISIFTAV